MRLIDADALYELLDNGFDIDFDELPETKAALLIMIEEQPTIEERKKGKWIAKTDIVSYWACSECLAVAMRDDYGQQVLTDYCSCCGARMEKE